MRRLEEVEQAHIVLSLELLAQPAYRCLSVDYSFTALAVFRQLLGWRAGF